MSLNRSNSWLTAVLTVLSLATSASAQHWQPFIEPDYFNPDLQFFAPAEVSEFGGGEPPNTGFYFTYDRMYINVTRPDGDNAPTPFLPGPLNPVPPVPGGIDSLGNLWSPWEGDFGWANRFDLGYMTEDKTGWNSVVWSLSGPNYDMVTIKERINRINEDDDPPDDPDPLVQDRNPRTYELHNSINNVTMSSFELNKVWRRKEFHNGGVFEPMIGVRYIIFNDIVRRDRYGRFFADPTIDNFPTLPETADGPAEVYTIDRTHWENNMLGGQLGFRLSKTYGHWHLSSEFRAFALQNWQFFDAQQTRRTTVYDGLGEGAEQIAELTDKDKIFENNDEFVWGGEVRGEAAYELTRDISLRVGFVFLDLGQGVARGNHRTQYTNQDVQMGGVSFGLTVNR